MTTATRFTARVKWFNPRTGYGFLTNTESSDDVFVHHSQITTGNNVYKTLTQGEYVEYETTTDESGKVLASSVTGLNRGPLLCERPQSTFRRQSGGNTRQTRTRGRGGARSGNSRRQEDAPAASSESAQ
jgi:CspA family cold shock protein